MKISDQLLNSSVQDEKKSEETADSLAYSREARLNFKDQPSSSKKNRKALDFAPELEQAMALNATHNLMAHSLNVNQGHGAKHPRFLKELNSKNQLTEHQLSRLGVNSKTNSTSVATSLTVNKHSKEDSCLSKELSSKIAKKKGSSIQAGEKEIDAPSSSSITSKYAKSHFHDALIPGSSFKTNIGENGSVVNELKNDGDTSPSLKTNRSKNQNKHKIMSPAKIKPPTHDEPPKESLSSAQTAGGKKSPITEQEKTSLEPRYISQIISQTNYSSEPHKSLEPQVTPQPSATLFNQANEDPSFYATLMPHAAHLSLAIDRENDIALHLRVHHGVTDVRIEGNSAQLLNRSLELEAALANEGLQLGQFDLSQERHGSRNDNYDYDAQPLPTRPLKTSLSNNEESTGKSSGKSIGGVHLKA